MKFTLKAILTIILLALAYTLAIQGVSRIYEDPFRSPFTGDSVFNPYQRLDFREVVKANFHAHTQFDTRETYTEGQFEKVYVDAGYDYVGVSNHNLITQSLIHRDNYVPTYEHGWNLNNYHILVLDAKTNDLLDNPFMVFPQSQMQWMINRLRNDATVLSLNHPERLRLATKKHYAALRGYDLMEADGNNDRSVWDEVLQQGNYIPLLSSDDAHSITNMAGPLQRAYTMVLSPNEANEIVEAVKNGHSYGVVGRGDALGEIYPRFSRIKVDKDTLWIALDSYVDRIDFISNAKIIKSVVDTNMAVLPTADFDNYVRVEAVSDDVTLVSNPIARSKTTARPMALPIPPVNLFLTILNSLIWGCTTLFILFLIFKLWRKRRKKVRRKSGNFENYTWGIGLKPYDPN